MFVFFALAEQLNILKERVENLFEGIFPTTWSCPAEQISLPEIVRGATAIDLYIEVASFVKYFTN